MLENGGAPIIHSPGEHSEASIDDENMENVYSVENPVQAILENDIDVSSHEPRRKRLCKDKKKYVPFIIFSALYIIYIRIYINIIFNKIWI